MEPRLGFATTSDGIRIGFAVTGEGPPLVTVPSPPDNHIQLEWEDPSRRYGVEALSRFRTVIRFDGRGTGLSDRSVTDFSLESRLKDLEAVIERLALGQFALLSGSHGNQLTIAYAVAHPERVTHLVAVNPFVHGADFMSPDQLNLWRTMLTTDYRLFTDALGGQMFGWGREEGPRYAEFFRRAVEPATALATYEAMIDVDLTPLLPQVRCPVLVLRSDDSSMVPSASISAFVAALPDVQFGVVDGPASEGTTAAMLRQIGRFFDETWDVASAPDRSVAARTGPGLQTVLFTDIEQHTPMMQRLGDVRGRAVLREHERITREALRQYGGSEVKAMGDGFLASFRSAQAALHCAIALQQAFALPLGESSERIRVRVGLNAGEPIAEDGDLFGTSVIRAARIASVAPGTEIFVANVVRELVEGKDFLFADRGNHALRGLDEPVTIP